MRKPSIFLSKNTLDNIWSNFSTRFKNQKAKDSYYCDINMCCDFLKKDFLEIQKLDAETYFLYLKSLIQKDEMKITTFIKKLRELSKFSSYIVENKKLYNVPAEFENFFEVYLLSLKEKEKIDYLPTLEEIDKVLYVASETNIMYYTIISIVFRTGIKPLEISELKFNDIFIDPNGTYIKVERNKSLRIVYIPDDLRDIIEKYIKTYYYNNKSERLFFNSRENALTSRYLERMMEELTQKADVEHFTLYDVRNLSASLMLAYGATTKQVSETLGITEAGILRYDEVLFDDDISKFANKLVKIKLELP